MKANSWIFLFLTICLTILIYSNHFNNPFEFDDSHTIETNLAIREIKNIPQFFKDAKTTSSLPVSQAYRPGLTTLNAIDFWLSGEEVPKPFQFHVSIFISYILLGLCIMYFAYSLFKHFQIKNASVLGIFVGGVFLIHTANTQTINYIIARSDSFSTFMILLSFVIYIAFPKLRKIYLYLLPSIFGFFVKEPVVMFVPLLFLYKYMIEEKQNIFHIFKKQNFQKAFSLFKSLLIPFIIFSLLVLFSRKMTPEGWNSGESNTLYYILSQPYSILHYFNNFIIPVNLVIDTDISIVERITDEKVIIGFTFLIAFIYLIYITSKSQPIIAYGLTWFLVALIPTSLIPLSEVLNDHRPFFPYIGLCISLIAFCNLIFQNIRTVRSMKIGFISLAILFVLLHSIGTYQQNKIWNKTETVWKECTIKAPYNPRGWMNYGNSLLSQGRYEEAEFAYGKAERLTQNYAYLEINIAILYESTNRKVEAEKRFLNALTYDSINPECYFYYAKFLISQNRIDNATQIIQKGLLLSNKHDGLYSLNNTLLDLKSKGIDAKFYKLEELIKTANTSPSAENYLNISLEYYNLEMYEKCIEACNNALKYNPNYDLAYNNICSAYIKMEKWDKAVEAGEKAYQLNPTSELINNNLNYAKSQLKK